MKSKDILQSLFYFLSNNKLNVIRTITSAIVHHKVPINGHQKKDYYEIWQEKLLN